MNQLKETPPTDVLPRQYEQLRVLVVMLNVASSTADVEDLKVAAFVNTTVTTVPVWYRCVIALRLMLATVGSLLVIVVLAIPTANAHVGQRQAR
ncbi:hypothetical protein ACIQUM_33075 [Amycolatopsis azurea]|uniref:hypothetical protein n=1 Tax=Amycolatopsis azurea TaxID=36819 RepID=UPI00380F0C84